jgi:hypothetical protein
MPAGGAFADSRRIAVEVDAGAFLGRAARLAARLGAAEAATDTGQAGEALRTKAGRYARIAQLLGAGGRARQ